MWSDQLLKTPLYDWHVSHGGRMVDFAGWSMPVQYSTITEEHQAIRQRVGLFDISHMGRLLVEGPGALDWVERCSTNHVAKLAEGQIQYSLMVNEGGGVLDDLLVYRLGEATIGIVCNASNREKVKEQLERHKVDASTRLSDMTLVNAMIAVQGPRSIEALARVVPAPLQAVKYYHFVTASFLGTNVSVSRTGYTGEDGFEVIVNNDLAMRLWEMLLEANRDLGVIACGLGARDTLRFEAAMCLYGHELSEETNPYAAGVGWAVHLNKGEFIGREALKALKTNPGRSRIGLALEGKRIARQGSLVAREGKPVGAITSGTFSISLGKSLAMALVDPTASAEGTRVSVDVRGHEEPARVVALPFYRRAGH
jgi:aminomethyltransferase